MTISRSQWLLFILGLLLVLLNPFISFLVNKISDRYQWETIPDWGILTITIAFVLLGQLVVWIIAELQKNSGNAADFQYATERRLENARRKTLQEVEKRVSKRLDESLHSDWLWPLSKHADINQVGLSHRSQGVVVRAGDMPEFHSQEPIINIFQHSKIQGELLILGAAGAGKTTILLDLAKELIEQAKQDDKEPLPLLFDLSNWQIDKQSIADWLESQLKDSKIYGVPPRIAKQWIQEREILPLLDGFDEIAPHRQELCVDKINQYLSNASLCPIGIAVCSRIEDYECYSQETKLNLNGAVHLEPFSNTDIEQICQRLEYPELWQGLRQNPALLALVRMPLFLSMAILSVKNDWQKICNWQACRTEKEQQQFLFNTYIDEKLNSLTIETRYYGQYWWQPKQFPTKEQSLIWLRWLAQTLHQNSVTDFYIEEIQPFFLTPTQYWCYRLISSLALGLIVGILLGTIGLLEKTFIFVLGGVVIGCLCGVANLIGKQPLEEEIVLIEAFRSPLETYEARLDFVENIRLGLWLGIRAGPIFGSVTGLVFIMLSDAYTGGDLELFGNVLEISGGVAQGITGFIAGLTFVFSLCILTGLVVGLQTSDDVIIRNKPNQGVWNTVRNSIMLSIFFYPMTFIAWAAPSLSYSLIAGDTISSVKLFDWLLPSLLISILLATFLGGGFSCLLHFVLRCILWYSGSIPWNYARFLQYAAEQRLLQQVGGSFRFIHDLLREHIAEEELT